MSVDSNVDSNVDFNLINTNDLVKMLDTEYNIYNYLTLDNESGTIIIDQRLDTVFKENKLFGMVKETIKTIKLKDILEKGFISIGSTDIMDPVNISCPHPLLEGLKPKITGRYMHGSRKELISKPTNINFEYDFDSDTEVVEDKKDYFDFDETLDHDETLGQADTLELNEALEQDKVLKDL